MELKDYVKIISKHKIFVVIVAILTVGLASLWQYLQPPNFSGAMTLSITNSPAQEDKDSYSNFYTISASPALIQTFEALFQSPNFVGDIYQDAEVALPISDVMQMQKILKTSRNQALSSAMVVSAKAGKSEDLVKIFHSAKKLTEAKITEYKSKKYISNNFNLDVSDGLILQNQVDYSPLIFISLIGGLIIGILASFSLEYFKE